MITGWSTALTPIASWPTCARRCTISPISRASVTRVLRIARAHVEPAHQAEYRAAVGALASRLANRHVHAWLFVNRDDPMSFVEFAEAGHDVPHRGAGDDPAERDIEQRLRALATYDGDELADWDAVPLTPEDADGSTGR